MNLGIDIDGCISNFTHKFTKWMFAKDKPILNGRVFEHMNEYAIYEKECYDECFDLPFYEDSKEILEKLSVNNKLTFVTKRGIYSIPEIKSNIEIKTIAWQKEHFPYFTGVFFARDKEFFFKNGMLDIMIEDDAGNANLIAEHAPVLLLSRPWNQSAKLHKNIAVVSDWKEIEFVINNFDKFYDSQNSQFR